MEKTKIHRNIAKLKSIDLFYLDTKTDGPTILCLHGRWGRAETWVDFMEHYGQQYRIIAPDQRGHGLSSKPISKYTAEEMAEDITELLVFLKIDSVILVGHSMGGRVAGYLTALYPKFVKALAILDRSASGPAKSNLPPLDQIPTIDPLTKDWPLPFSSLTEAQDFIRQAMDSNLSYQYFMNSLVETVDGYQMMFSSQAMAAGIAYDVNWFHLLPSIKCPVLLIRAKDNDAVSDEDFVKMQSLIPNCLAHEVSHPDHNVHLANKEEFYGYFDELLKKT
ncbi:2-succinyl-6-hydroxy-2,4-cyclohexadiene-1-carboxylate synthase [Paenibacillus sophorae]|uniref:2-succinyl-6-hydroxy-2,4-cyclohexadiene-1-carboxylate synthase n=1 Tax=Paenibacillus sophorae TaxID=1333845 RepID=A0A1H8KAV1_9BACL|nr:alpha/beta hydrolase [Paenibacillus sophorae]QWU13677.1 alpha/beta hydrolase [Paenibacillus sophorae]SEN90054.1 2-succinyl-6-hydroxy-2,4-cyclohexadiene-1-carboxylate synthase [Paenibacillus sophorae]